ncbi:MAG: zinc-dependent metalloprotease [Carbonactinosporaceae bacterium]
MVDWDLAVATAARLVRPGPEVTRREAREVVEELRQHAAEAEAHVRAFSRLSVGGGGGPVMIVDRPSWARANVEGFRVVLEPLVDKIRARRDATAGGSLVTAVGARVTGVELGSLLAFLAGKVLGQYETFAPQADGANGPGRLLLVAPNVVQTEREMAVDPHDFRLWVCIHEETHRTQFTAVPWLRDHLEGEVHAFLAETDVDPSAFLRRMREVADVIGGATRGREEASLLDAIQTPAQRVILERLTAAMSLLEGHADYVMDGVGPRVVPSVRQIRHKFQRRRESPGRVDGLLRRLLGIDVKLRQYRDGERFVRRVVNEVGMDGFNRVWTSPNTLPGPAEISDPHMWVRRIHGGRPASGEPGMPDAPDTR